MPPMHRCDVCVSGSGAVAMSVALALSRIGLDVVITAPPRRGRADDVRAYALNDESVALLGQLKVWDALPPDARTAVYDMHVEGDVPGAALEFSAWAQRREQLAWIVDAAELEAALAAALGFAPHVRLAEPGVDVDAALHVYAEGRDSAARERLGVPMRVQRYGHRALAARLTADRAHAGRARQWFRSPDVLALLPFDRPRAGHSYGLVWSLPDARAAELLALPPPAFEQELMQASGGAAGALQLASERASWPLTVARAEAVCGSGWVLVGDAAHVVHPLAGQGLNLGLGDVVVLVDELAAREPWRALGDERLLRRYARRRAAPTLLMAGLTDALWQLFASPHALAKELRNRGLGLVNRLTPLKRALAAQAIGSPAPAKDPR